MVEVLIDYATILVNHDLKIVFVINHELVRVSVVRVLILIFFIMAAELNEVRKVL